MAVLGRWVLDVNSLQPDGVFSNTLGLGTDYFNINHSPANRLYRANLRLVPCLQITNISDLLSAGVGTDFGESSVEIKKKSFRELHLKCCLQNAGHFVDKFHVILFILKTAADVQYWLCTFLQPRLQ